MAEQKNSCGCGCLPLKRKEVKTTVATKAAKGGKEASDKSKQ